jgi:type 1 glutamine amidotransferase
MRLDPTQPGIGPLLSIRNRAALRSLIAVTSASAKRGFMKAMVLRALRTALPLLALAGTSETRVVAGAGSFPPANLVLNDAEARQRIEAALPTKAIVPPRRPRRLLLFDLNVGYGGHPSAGYANYAFTRIGEKTGAYQAVTSHDPAVFAADSLSQFDAVFFNNTVGNLFTDPVLRQNLVRFVYRGGGLLGVHGTSVAFTQWPGALEDWPEFGLMLGARGANHRENTERVTLAVEDPDHPLTRVFPRHGFEYRDEFFRVHEPYSRQRVRVLLRIDTNRTDLAQGRGFGNLERPDGDFALAWVRNYGRGRTFYCTIAHNPYVFWDARMLEFYFRAIQFALGDLPAPTAPSSYCTPALHAQERLGWRLGLAAPKRASASTLFETIDQAAALRLAYLQASDRQAVSRQAPKSFSPLGDRGDLLSEGEMRDLRVKLDAAGVRLLAYELTQTPADLAAWRRLFAFARDLGVEVITAQPPRALLPAIARLGQDYELRLALTPAPATNSPKPGSPVSTWTRARRFAPWLGVDADLADWEQLRLDPVRTARKLADGLAVVRLNGATFGLTPAAGAEPQQPGSSASLFLRDIHRSSGPPPVFLIPHESPPSGQALPLIGAFGRAALRLAPPPERRP